jgi:hypothetical protein
MALLLADSFDTYSSHTELTLRWTQRYTAGGTLATEQIGAFGRRSTNAFRATATTTTNAFRTPGLAINLAASGATFVAGFSLTVTGLSQSNLGSGDLDPTASGASPSQALVAVRQLGITHVFFKLNTDGTIGAYRGTTLLGTTSGSVSNGVTSYWEFLVTISNTVGVVTVKKDGVSVLSLTSQDTNNGSASDAWTEAIVGRIVSLGTTMTWDYDDLYICDGSGSAPQNTFLGDVRVDVLRPTADGNSQMSTPSTGSDQYAMVDETTPNSDTDYNTLAAAADKDTFTTGNAPVSGATVFGVQTVAIARKEDAGTATLNGVVRHSGTDYDGSASGVSSSYSAVRNIFAVNPGTAAAWSTSEVDAAEFGYKRAS